MICKKCNLNQDAAAFYSSNPNRCKQCVKDSVNSHRQANIEKIRAYDRMRGSMPHRKLLATKVISKWKATHPNRRSANVAVGNAVRDGRLEKQLCWSCGEKAVAHHPDYDRPLDVVWLCQAHHKQAHALVPAERGQVNENSAQEITA